jgi:glycosyltransferase involved in cell wall biosynthesis
MRIAIATGIYPPEVGGPALYAQGVERALIKMGHEASLVIFSPLKKYPSGIRHLLYTWKLFRMTRGADAIFAFDTYSAGVPASLVARMRRIPLVIRIGGDFVWECYIERTGELIPLTDFYQRDLRWSAKERFAFLLVKWMLRRAQLAFNTRWLYEIWREKYGIIESQVHIVENVTGERLSSLGTDKKVLLYVRNIAFKNSKAFKRAFEKAQSEGVMLELEEGRIPHEKLIDRIRHAYAVAVPSISEVAPNTVMDAIRCGKPFILTKYSGYAERFKGLGIIIDPLSEDDMARGIRDLSNETTYRSLTARIAAFDEVRTYEDVAKALLLLV